MRIERDIRRSILVVGGDDEALPFLRGFRRFEVLNATSVRETLALLALQPVDLIIVDFLLPDGNGVALLEECARRVPIAKRMLIAAYDELPRVIAAGIRRDLVTCILPRGRWTHAFQRAVLHELEGPPALTDAPAPGVLGWAELDDLLKQTLIDATSNPGVIIRPLHPDPQTLMLQLVLPRGAAFDRFRCALPRTWGWPTANLGQMKPWQRDSHPVTQYLGRLLRGQEVYVKRINEESLYAYLAILPWIDEPFVTLLFGLWCAEPTPALRKVIVGLHAFTTETAPAFFLYLPDVQRGPTETIDYIKEYNWVVTDLYVGPDRRDRETPLLSRYLFWGNRRRIPKRLEGGTAFVDRLSARAAVYVAAYVALSAIDTALTFWFVRRGVVSEMNPLLRQLLSHHPWLFLSIKNAFSLIAILVVSRFHLFRIAKYLLPLNVLLYAALDAYWITLVGRLAWSGSR